MGARHTAHLGVAGRRREEARERRDCIEHGVGRVDRVTVGQAVPVLLAARVPEVPKAHLQAKPRAARQGHDGRRARAPPTWPPRKTPEHHTRGTARTHTRTRTRHAQEARARVWRARPHLRVRRAVDEIGARQHEAVVQPQQRRQPLTHEPAHVQVDRTRANLARGADAAPELASHLRSARAEGCARAAEDVDECAVVAVSQEGEESRGARTGAPTPAERETCPPPYGGAASPSSYLPSESRPHRRESRPLARTSSSSRHSAAALVLPPRSATYAPSYTPPHSWPGGSANVQTYLACRWYSLCPARGGEGGASPRRPRRNQQSRGCYHAQTRLQSTLTRLLPRSDATAVTLGGAALRARVPSPCACTSSDRTQSARSATSAPSTCALKRAHVTRAPRVSAITITRL
eukprot:7386319-Prymnesium_polylepis.1